jgi:hypothetical protein
MRGKGKEDVALWACPSLLIYPSTSSYREKRGLVLPPTLPLLATPINNLIKEVIRLLQKKQAKLGWTVLPCCIHPHSF